MYDRIIFLPCILTVESFDLFACNYIVLSIVFALRLSLGASDFLLYLNVFSRFHHRLSRSSSGLFLPLFDLSVKLKKKSKRCRVFLFYENFDLYFPRKTFCFFFLFLGCSVIFVFLVSRGLSLSLHAHSLFTSGLSYVINLHVHVDLFIILHLLMFNVLILPV